MNPPKQIQFEYGFPLFVPPSSKTYLVKIPKIRLSDIWGFWDYLVKMLTLKRGKIDGNFLPMLLEQAKYFYQAAEKAPLKSQPLLYYYSFLNLAKIVVNVNWPYGNSTEYYHGIETKINNKTTLDNAEVTFKQYGGSGSTRISVAREFFMYMGDVVSVPGNTCIKKLLASCVGIHRTYSETFNQKESFYRLDNASFVKKHGMVLEYESDVNGIDDVIMRNLVAAKGYNISKNKVDGQNIYKYNETLNMTSYNVSKMDWFMLSNKMIKKGICHTRMEINIVYTYLKMLFSGRHHRLYTASCSFLVL